MGDRCWVQIEVRKQDREILEEVFGEGPEMENDTDYGTVTCDFSEMNYGGVSLIEELTKHKIPFHVLSGAGGSYPPAGGASPGDGTFFEMDGIDSEGIVPAVPVDPDGTISVSAMERKDQYFQALAEAQRKFREVTA